MIWPVYLPKCRSSYDRTSGGIVALIEEVVESLADLDHGLPAARRHRAGIGKNGAISVYHQGVETHEELPWQRTHTLEEDLSRTRIGR